MKSVLGTGLFLSLLTLIGCSNGGGNSKNTFGGGPSTPTVSSVQVAPVAKSIGIGGTQQFTATALLSDGTSKDVTSSAQWASSDTNIASIDAAGVATGSASGTVTITAQSGTLQGNAALNVTAAAANLISIVISPAASSMPVHTSQQFTATGNYGDGSSADLTTLVTWSSSSTATATISVTGLATAAAVGSTSISANFAGVSTSTALTVTAPTIVSIAVTPVGLTLGIGINQQYVATATYSDGSSADLSGGVTWTSSSSSVASINASGMATTLAAGQTTITATVGSLTDTSTLTVVAAHLISISVTPATQVMAVGTTQQFTAVGSFDDGSTQLLSSLTWSSSSNSVAAVSATGVVTAVGIGTATLTAASGSISGTAALTISSATLVSIAVTPTNPSMAVGTTKQFIATGTFSDASTQDVTAIVVWTSSSPATATINGQGVVTSVAAGSTTIKALFGSVSGSTTLTVSTAHLVSIAINPANARIAQGTLVKFTATGTFSDGSVGLNLSGLTWKSSKPNLASVRSTGIAHGKKAGTVTISASASGITGSTTLTVGSGTLVSLAVTPATVTAAAGTTQPFVATGTFSDGSTQDITLNAHWSSSSAPIATVANAPSVAGSVNCISAGTSTIGANSGGTTGSAVLTVQ
jgi:trimeric autotransporter adhesin